MSFNRDLPWKSHGVLNLDPCGNRVGADSGYDLINTSFDPVTL